MADLWIRSQNKERLIKATDVHLDFDKIIMSDKHFMGEYETPKRALEVLDEIQSILSDNVVVFKNFRFDATEDLKKLEQIIGTRCIAIQDNTDTIPTVDFKNKNCIVYSMPKD
ncbi:MAG: hypothetical protein IJ371_05295 [Clostridia bacterium]|nr:hypothetical protein [Clostridia bacterium]